MGRARGSRLTRGGLEPPPAPTTFGTPLSLERKEGALRHPPLMSWPYFAGGGRQPEGWRPGSCPGRPAWGWGRGSESPKGPAGKQAQSDAHPSPAPRRLLLLHCLHPDLSFQGPLPPASPEPGPEQAGGPQDTSWSDPGMLVYYRHLRGGLGGRLPSRVTSPRLQDSDFSTALAAPSASPLPSSGADVIPRSWVWVDLESAHQSGPSLGSWGSTPSAPGVPLRRLGELAPPWGAHPASHWHVRRSDAVSPPVPAAYRS